MKGQQLFHSFLPSVTAVVLTTQPAWAETVKVSGVQLAASRSALSFTSGETSITDSITRKLPNTARDRIPAIIPAASWTTVTLEPLISNSFRATVTGKTKVLIGQKSIVSSWMPTSNPSTLADRITAVHNQKKSINAIAPPELENIFVPASISKLASLQKPTLVQGGLFSQKLVADKRNPNTELLKVSEISTYDSTAARLLAKVPSCPQKPQNSQTFSLTDGVIDLKACRKKNSTGNLEAQAPTRTPAKITPVPTPAPRGGVQTPTPTITPAFSGEVQIPDYLNQSPNPLQFPTKPEDVTVQGIQPITLAQALELARRNNRDLQVSLLQLQRTQYALREAQATLLPSASLSANLARSGQNAIFGESQLGVNPDATTNFQGLAQLSYDLYTSGRRQASIRGFEEQVRLQELDVERQSEEIRLNVATDYYNLQQADETVRINTAAVTNAQASLRDAQALEQAGVGTRFAVLQSQVNLANAQQDLTNSRSQQQIARRQLVNRLNLSQSVNVSAADRVGLAGLWNQTLEQSIILALQNRPELQQQLAQRNFYEQQRRGALAQLGPQVSVVAQYRLQDQFNDNISSSDNYSVGLQASLNLYDGGAARARAAQQRSNIAIAETQFASQRDTVRFQVEQAYSNLQANLQNVNTATGALEQARESLRLARLRFQAGVGTQTEVIDAETALTRAEGNRVRAILDYNRALASLQRYVTSRALR